MTQDHMIVEETARRWLSERGVTIPDIADLVYGLQKDCAWRT
ncbi:hypothetical protein [Salipaludibacillus neizhouensis]|nr:hypothetical protein [Salipaludibacillus neizhouensis]